MKVFEIDLVVWCIGAALLVIVPAGCTSTTKIMCPSLSPAPSSIIDALETASRKDPSAAAWTIGLDKHYAKLDACR